MKSTQFRDFSGRLPPCGGSGLKFMVFSWILLRSASPSMRREWIEMLAAYYSVSVVLVSLHAEGVD